MGAAVTHNTNIVAECFRVVVVVVMQCCTAASPHEVSLVSRGLTSLMSDHLLAAAPLYSNME
ncbi:TPA: hypothetical protein ACH3X2_006262 [Trebouxia sp. C0005]